MSSMLRLALLLAVALASACDVGAEGTDAGGDTTGAPEPPPSPPPGDDCEAGAPEPGPYPAPRTDVVPAVGTADTFDVATWNIENLEATADRPSRVADLVASLALDFVAVQEIVDEAAFFEIVDRLPGYDGLVADIGAFHNVGYLYRTDVATVTDPLVWFRSDGFAFPREPFSVSVTVGRCGTETFDFSAVTVHLKAGRGGDDADRRLAANEALDGLTRRLVDEGEDEVILLGDFNERLDTSGGREVMAPWLDATAYRIQTQGAVDDDGYSYVPSRAFYDHIITTVGFDDEAAGNVAFVVPLDRQYPDYVDVVSDHLPVVLRLPLP